MLVATLVRCVPSYDVTLVQVGMTDGVRMKQARLGSQIFFKIEVRDLTSSTQALTNTDSNECRINLRKPNGVVAVSLQSMTNASTGTYTYTYTTAATDPPGTWRVYFKLTKSSAVVLTPEMDAIEMVP